MPFFNYRTRTTSLNLLVLACICFVHSFAEPPRFEHLTKGDGSLSFLVIGDWGRRGFYNQTLVAYQMGKVAEKLNIDFVVSTGDNFYDNGLEGVDDPAFEDSFTKIYTAKGLQKQWYSILGNHDYRGDVEAQLSPILSMIDGRWLCRRSFLVNTEMADIFFVDTTPFVEKYFADDEHNYNWQGLLPRRKYIAETLEALESGLRDSSANWKMVVGHHAIRSAGFHGETEELIQLLLPILKANNVDFYMNGHDHCLEHISSLDSPIQYLTSGGGSKAWRGDTKHEHYHDGMKFFYDGQGFMSVELTQAEAQIMFYNVYGDVLHKWKTSKEFHSAV
ncbi:purple acid phosphatase 17-like [Pistacia vera]|uniref:purple acid phosphatase 17-like n=1 Tax=Pistacia vera TaxID=55513 RepID=UPI001262E668|nr:purple acid phosphatase 17-like [Pistacia vera]